MWKTIYLQLKSSRKFQKVFPQPIMSLNSGRLNFSSPKFNKIIDIIWKHARKNIYLLLVSQSLLHQYHLYALLHGVLLGFGDGFSLVRGQFRQRATQYTCNGIATGSRTWAKRGVNKETEEENTTYLLQHRLSGQGHKNM